jgi:uncharacterized cupin superfamily protein
MLAAGFTRVTDLMCVTMPAVPVGGQAVTQLVDLPPGDKGLKPHRHSGPVFGYVLHGKILFELEGQVPRELAAGMTFWAPGGDVVCYQVANLLPEAWTRVLTVRVCAPGVARSTAVDPDEIAARESVNWSFASRKA